MTSEGLGDLNLFMLEKGGEKYVFIFDDRNRAAIVRAAGRFAANPELSFSWYDAALVVRSARSRLEVDA